MRKCALMIMAAVAIVGVALAAASYTVISLPESGESTPTGISVGNAAWLQIEGAVSNDGYVAVSRISDSGPTNELFRRTVASGAFSGPLTNIWIMAGDRLYRSGTVTNKCRVRLILDGGN